MTLDKVKNIMAKLFFSYSHKDEELRNELETHLALLKRQGVLSSWHDCVFRSNRPPIPEHSGHLFQIKSAT